MQFRSFPLLSLLPIAALALACNGGSGDAETPGPDSGTSTGGSADAGGNLADAAAPVPDAAPVGTVCQAKDPVVQVGYTCNFVWSQCSDGDEYTLDCHIENVGGNVFSLCDCIVNGSVSMQTLSSEVCSQADWPSVEAIVNEKCGWDLR